MRTAIPRTLKGFRRWLKTLTYQMRRTIMTDVNHYPDDSSQLSRLKEWHRHLIKGHPLPSIGDIKHIPETPESRLEKEEVKRRLAVMNLQTTRRERILINKLPDNPRKKLPGSSQPPWPWPR